jgi:hypothetical protein
MSLLQPVKTNELHKYLDKKRNENPRGTDGLSLKFYPTMWEYIKEDTKRVCKEMPPAGLYPRRTETWGISV